MGISLTRVCEKIGCGHHESSVDEDLSYVVRYELEEERPPLTYVVSNNIVERHFTK